MDGSTIVAIASTVVAAVSVGGVALWKLATMIAEVRTIVTGELHHDGGGSTKDYARQAAEEATGARRAADLAHWRIDALDREMILLRGVRNGHREARDERGMRGPEQLDGLREHELAGLRGHERLDDGGSPDD